MGETTVEQVKPVPGGADSVSTVMDRVAKGAALLDEKQPGWMDRLDMAALYLGSCEACVLGQVFGDYIDGRDRLFGNAWPEVVKESRAHGFSLPVTMDSIDDYDTLTDEWKRVITSRREQSARPEGGDSSISAVERREGGAGRGAADV